MFVGVQVATFYVSIAILYTLIMQKKLPLMSTRFYLISLLVSIFTIFAELVFMFTMGFSDLPVIVHRISYGVFIGGINAVLYTLYLYLDSKVRFEQRRSVKEIIAAIAPFIISIVWLFIVPPKLNYETRTASGLVLVSNYICAILYLGLAAFTVSKNRASIRKEQYIAFFVGAGLWLSLAVMKVIFPKSTLNSVGVLCLLFFLYVYFENPRDYMVQEIDGAYNRYAFERMIAEIYANKKEFYLVHMAIIKNMSHEETIKGLRAVTTMFKEFRMFNVLDNTFCAIAFDQSQLDILRKYKVNSSGITFKYYVIKCPELAKTPSALLSLIEYIDDHKQEIKHPYINKEVLNNKYYLETVLQITKDAIQNDGFYMVYQPIYSTVDHKFTSMEALVRLKDTKTIGFVSPEVFITLAEQNGLINEVSRVVFRNVCRFFKEKNLTQYGIKYVEVNVSALQGMDPNFSKEYINIMNEYGIDPKHINLEITETASVLDSHYMTLNMANLKEAGAKFSLDDFGTGYSSIRKMVEMKFELVKLDKSLLWPAFGFKCDVDAEARAVLDETIKMIKNIKSSIVAEGVETEEMVKFLINNDVEHIQGYYYSKPLSEDDFIEFIKERNM